MIFFFLLNEKYYNASTSEKDKDLLRRVLLLIQDKALQMFRNSNVLLALKNTRKACSRQA